MTERQPLFAYAMRGKDGALRILHSLDEDSKLNRHYRIPVSASREPIERYGNFVTGQELEHEVMDISPLLEVNVISPDRVMNLDLEEKRRRRIPIISAH